MPVGYDLSLHWHGLGQSFFFLNLSFCKILILYKLTNGCLSFSVLIYTYCVLVFSYCTFCIVFFFFISKNRYILIEVPEVLKIQKLGPYSWFQNKTNVV